MKRWQYVIAALPLRPGDPVRVLHGDTLVTSTSQPDEAAYAMFIRWRDHNSVPTADLLDVVCLVRLEGHRDVAGVAYGRDWL